MRVAFKTLGCRVNLFETDALASRFKAGGYEVVDAGEADIFVVNTCTVTNTSDPKEKPRSLVGRHRLHGQPS